MRKTTKYVKSLIEFCIDLNKFKSSITEDFMPGL